MEEGWIAVVFNRNPAIFLKRVKIQPWFMINSVVYALRFLPKSMILDDHEGPLCTLAFKYLCFRRLPRILIFEWRHYR